MVEIKCSKAQYTRIINTLIDGGPLIDGRCILGKTFSTCPALKGKPIDCPTCIKNNFKHVPTEEKTENKALVPPCEIGQTVWFIRNKEVFKTSVEKIILKEKGMFIKLACNAMYETSCNSIGKTVFFSDKEAFDMLRKKNEDWLKKI